MTTKSIYAALLLTITILASCSKKSDVFSPAKPPIDNKGNEITAVKIGLTSKDTVSTAFNSIAINLKASIGSIYDLYQSYDSIICRGNFGDSSLTILSSKTSTLSIQWSTNFYYPGNYKIYLNGFKNGKVIAQDSLSFKISADKPYDFIKHNWSDPETIGMQGLTNPYIKNNIYFGKFKKNGISSIYVQSLPENIKGNIKNLYQRNDLYNFIKSYYGNPAFSDTANQDALLKNYDALFDLKIQDEKPIYIWQTQKNNIVLLEKADMYYVRAEQRK